MGSRVRVPLEARLFPNLNGSSLHWAFHVHSSIVLIWWNEPRHDKTCLRGVSGQVRLKLACLATETSQSLESFNIASNGITLSRQRKINVLIRLRGCAGWSAPLLFAYGIKQVFSWRGSNTVERDAKPRHIRPSTGPYSTDDISVDSHILLTNIPLISDNGTLSKWPRQHNFQVVVIIMTTD